MYKKERETLQAAAMTNAQRSALLALLFRGSSNIIEASGGAMRILPENAPA
jgi:hypothetical protein